MKKALFQPFDLNKWLALGFTAFLAGLVDHGGGGSGGNSSRRGYDKDFDATNIFEFPQIAYDWLLAHPWWLTMIIIGIGLIFIISIVLIWLSSRGKFMFLSNVLYDEAEVTKPWNEYKKEGNSLFLWRFVFTYLVFFIIIIYFVYCFIALRETYYEYYSFAGQFLLIFSMIIGFLFIVILSSYISLFLNDFIVPIMAKNRIGTNAAWRKFMSLLSEHAAYFLLYGLFIFVLGILVFITIVAFGLLTCCIGFLLLIIPYIGSVVLLPISYTFRAFSVEFLEQFGDDYQLFPQLEETPEITA